jgi:CheY-like chemotaxis protein
MADHVLVVEDDPDILSSLVEVLREEGFTVLSAANGYQALEQLAAGPVDLVLLDLMMPVMDGWRFLREAEARYPELRPPVVLLSAVRELDVEAERLGIKSFLQKPFELEKVVRLAHELLAARRGRHVG